MIAMESSARQGTHRGGLAPMRAEQSEAAAATSSSSACFEHGGLGGGKGEVGKSSRMDGPAYKAVEREVAIVAHRRTRRVIVLA